MYSGDCIDRLPQPYPRLTSPLHQIGLAAMGLAILDSPDVESLGAVCRELDRFDFLVMCAPLRIPGGTGSAVNPLCVF